MTDFIRGQIIFRRAVGSVTPDYSQPRHARFESGYPFVYDIALALIECDPGTYADEQLLPFTLSGAPDSFRLSLDRRGDPVPDYARIDKLDGLLRTMQIKPPFLGSLLCCGGMVLRKTRFPGAPGRVVMAGAGIMRSPITVVPEKEMFSLLGSPSRLTMGSPEPVPEAFPDGSNPSQTFDKPIWGFGERRAIPSTLHLDVLDHGKEIIPLLYRDDLSEAEARRLEELKASPLCEPFKVHWKDELFAEYYRRSSEAGAVGQLDSYPTAEERQRQRRVVDEIVKAMVEEQRREDSLRYA